MTQRNPLNERNQLREGGKTRKSAASAKPVRKAAASVYIEDPKAKQKKSFLDRFKKKEETPVKKAATPANENTDEKPKKKGGKWTLSEMEGSEKMESTEGYSEETKKAAKAKYQNPGTKEYKMWRTIWWVVIALGICSLLPPVLMPDYFNNNESISMLLLGLGYALLIAAVIIDAVKIRPLRKSARGGALKDDRSKEATAARKAAKKEAVAKEEAKIAKKAARKNS
jgi:hypothetical protein